jgi:hypothetical protein
MLKILSLSLKTAKITSYATLGCRLAYRMKTRTKSGTGLQTTGTKRLWMHKGKDSYT